MVSIISGCAHLDHASPPVDNCISEAKTSIETLVTNNRALLIGELHGTNEMPAQLVEIIKQAAITNKKIVITLEYDFKWQPVLDQYFDENTTSELFSTKDGRTSDAMLNMLAEVKSLKSEFENIHVSAVDYWPKGGEIKYRPAWIDKSVDISKAQRDIGMGTKAVDACSKVDCDLLIYYAGNFHTRRTVAQGATLSTETGKITRYKSAPAGYIIAHHMNTASIFLSHRGGAIAAITNKGFGVSGRKPNTPDFVKDDHYPYCHTKNLYYDYILSVGTITKSL